MITQAVGLADIARGDASPAQAGEVLRFIFSEPTPDLLRDAYLALRAWVWKALDQRRRDPELRDWNDILGAASTLMRRHGQDALGSRIDALHELVAESIAVADTYESVDITRRLHVARVLEFLAESGGQASQSAIGERTGLAEANLTDVLNMMSAAGLLERSTLGKEAVFALSRAGEAAQQNRAA
ncbi:MarR family transcriptional regulator (plasmid) [Rhodovastum atsumiense]|nr:MarR family transcriptional regulator [Rhodovastum atsumiense]CAH2606166.1 MarR family transcriptional regulator [Rhodovastum atsumiense]